MFRFLLFFSFFPMFLFAQRYLPKSSGEIIRHSVLTLSYIEEHEQAAWVYYESSIDLTQGTFTRKDNFREDNKVSSHSASLTDYANSGYDRGHLAPAQDMKATQISMSESFFLSNMSPQLPSFNRGGNWRKLEDAVHNWGRNNVVVVTGPVFQNNLGVIGINQVTVPESFYKVVYWPKAKKMLGFIVPQISNKRSLQECIVPVDVIERMTAIDFFPQLDDALEKKLEADMVSEGWDFSQGKVVSTNTKVTAMSNTPQCIGKTKKGTQCKRKASQGGKYCYQHHN